MRRYHLCLNIEEFLRSTKFPSGYLGMFRDDAGNELEPRAARDTLRIESMKGRKVIPMSKECGSPCKHSDAGCTDFDYSGGGCPGHLIEEGAV
ncbi:MAG: hypothetical protein JSV72_00830 [Ralstonia sp.]|jgi:hypothetical protein|nr:MAG: hypothetical protein JSV72_00830 [Ralstonia sp.]